MNYYERHLGDYAKDTAHLSMIEHGAYNLLLDRYYATESAIPLDMVYRICRARSKDEKNTVDTVIKEFFVIVDGHVVNGRSNEEIAKARKKIFSAQKNGLKGGRPKKVENIQQNQQNAEPTGFMLGYENETQSKAHQTPDTSKPIQAYACKASPEKPAIPNCPFEEIISTYHAELPELPQYRVRTEKRDGVMRQRWRQFYASGDFKTSEEGIECFRWYFTEKVKPSKFLTGRINGKDRPFRADLEWLMLPSNFAKVLEGRYE